MEKNRLLKKNFMECLLFEIVLQESLLEEILILNRKEGGEYL